LPKNIDIPDGILTEAELESVIHPDRGQNPISRSAFAIEAAEDQRGLINIDGYTDDIFFVSTEPIRGPIFVLPEFVVSWNIESLADLTVGHFSLLKTVYPAVDLIIIGCGKYTTQLPPELIADLLKVSPFEIMPSNHACATFNMLSTEDRQVAAAIMPITYIHDEKG